MVNRNPLRVYCKNCGAPVGFDILWQTYACKNCGKTSGIKEAKDDVIVWRALNQEKGVPSQAGEIPAEFCCTACGAHILFKEGEASETCDFCGSKLMRAEFTDEGQTPDLIIPFFITAEEARKRMLEWGHENGNTPEGQSVISGMGGFKGYYLPYQLVKGPVYAEITRDGSKRKYQCAGYLEGTAVSTSDQLDNRVLNEMEPFDWSAARPFSYGYVAGQNIKLSNMSGKELEERVLEEAAADFLPEVERVMQTSGVGIKMHCDSLMGISVLLPVYFIKTKKLTAVMNGQTGRIAVTRNRVKKTTPWVIEPLICTLIATGLLSIPYQFQLEPMCLFAFVFGAIFFSVMGEGGVSLTRRITLRTEAARAERKKGELRIEEGKGILKNPYDNTPVFYEQNERGEVVPVRIRFYSPGRILSILANAAVTMLLPLLIAAAIRLVTVWGTSAEFLDGIRPMGGAAWYIFAGFLVILYFAKGVRRDVYNHPILYDVSPGGGKRLGTRDSGRLSVFSVFGLCGQDEHGNRVSLFQSLKKLGGPGIFLGGFVIVLLVGSIAAILV